MANGLFDEEPLATTPKETIAQSVPLFASEKPAAKKRSNQPEAELFGDALFSEDTSAQATMSGSAGVDASLFEAENLTKIPSNPVGLEVAPLALDEKPTVQQREMVHAPDPMRLDETMPAAPQSFVQGPKPVTLDVGAPAVPQSVMKAPEPQEVFASQEDPLVTQALRHAQAQFPDIFDKDRRTLKSRFESLFPLDFDRISHYAEKTLRHVPTVMQEVTQASETLSTLSVPAVIQEISTQAQAAAGGGTSAGHGLAGMLKKMESRVRPFDPQIASNRLMQLYGGVKSIHGRLSGVQDLAQDVFTQIQTDIRVLAVLKVVAEKTPVETAVTRRYDLIVVTGQQMQLGMKQLEALRGQTENSLMQIEEMRTVTLPSLGFLGAIRG